MKISFKKFFSLIISAVIAFSILFTSGRNSLIFSLNAAAENITDESDYDADSEEISLEKAEAEKNKADEKAETEKSNLELASYYAENAEEYLELRKIVAAEALEALESAQKKYDGSASSYSLTPEEFINVEWAKYYDDGSSYQTLIDVANAVYPDSADKSTLNFDYILKSLDFIDEFNAIRRRYGISECKVDPILMMDQIREADMNDFSSSGAEVGHSEISCAGSRNLAWGYTDPDEAWMSEEENYKNWIKENPFLPDAGWVDGEGFTNVYEFYISCRDIVNIGHYINFLDARLKSVGFGWNGSNNTAAWGADYNDNERLLTTDEIRLQIKKRQDSNNKENVLNLLNSAKSAKEKADEAVTAAQNAYNETLSDKEAAEAAYKEALDNQEKALENYEYALEISRNKQNESDGVKFAWSDDYSACSATKNGETVEAEISRRTLKEATEKEEGEEKITAAATFSDGKIYYDTVKKAIPIPPAEFKLGNVKGEITSDDTGKKIIVIYSRIDSSSFINNAGTDKSYYKITDYDGKEKSGGEALATGDKINLSGRTYEIAVLGDVTRDGNVNAQDARLALRYSAKLEKLSDIQTEAAKVSKSEKVSASEARQILRYSAKLQDKFTRET